MENLSRDNLPDDIYSLRPNCPYAEIGFGLENIFKCIRVNAIWRLTYLDHNEASPFRVQAGVHFSL